MVHRDEPCSVDTIQEDDVDWQLAWNTAKRLWSDENRRLDYLAREIHRTERFLRHEQSREAILQISAALLENGVLNGRQVRELYEQANLCSA
jgi:hypothetical protein